MTPEDSKMKFLSTFIKFLIKNNMEQDEEKENQDKIKKLKKK